MRLPDLLTASLVEIGVPGTALRVAVDGPGVADPAGLAQSLIAPLSIAARPGIHVRTETFWRDASLRLEYDRTDPESFAGWLDACSLHREVLEPLGPGGSGSFLPSLRDPASNRATREPARAAEPGQVVLISGPLLLGFGLPFDVTIHLAVSPSARRRRTPAPWQWTMPAFDDYDAKIEPVRRADLVLRYDDPAHPAIRLGPPAPP